MNQEIRFENDGLSILLLATGPSATVRWSGVSDSRNPTVFLGPVIERLTEYCGGLNTTVDFTEMEFMNSSTISPVIGLVKTLNEKCPDVLVLFADTDWQKVHARCMKTITRVLKQVRVEERAVEEGRLSNV